MEWKSLEFGAPFEWILVVLSHLRLIFEGKLALNNLSSCSTLVSHEAAFRKKLLEHYVVMLCSQEPGGLIRSVIQLFVNNLNIAWLIWLFCFAWM